MHLTTRTGADGEEPLTIQHLHQTYVADHTTPISNDLHQKFQSRVQMTDDWGRRPQQVSGFPFGDSQARPGIVPDMFLLLPNKHFEALGLRDILDQTTAARSARKRRLPPAPNCREFSFARCGGLPPATSFSDIERCNRSRASLNPAWS